MLDSLPSVEELAHLELADLARLHMSSATNLRHTMHLLAPDVFTGTSGIHPDNDTLSELDGAQSDTVAVLIELQLFHLQRASALLAHLKAVRTQPQDCKPNGP
jgi:hypothetical protein